MPKSQTSLFRKILSITVKTMVFLLLAILLVSGAAIYIFNNQQTRLVNLALTELNEQFKGELFIEKSQISVFKNFPYVSIDLQGARFYDNKHQQRDPLYRVDHLYIGFSVKDIIQQKYHAKRLMLKGGEINLIRHTNGKLNIEVAKNIQSDTGTTSSEPSSSFDINLKKIVLRDLEVNYIDNISHTKIHSSINRLLSSFSANDDHILIDLKSKLMVDIISDKDTSFFRRKQFALNIDADYHTTNKLLDITLGKITLEDAKFSVEGKANLSDVPSVDLKIHGDKPNFDLIAAFLPENVRQSLAPFKYDGRVYFEGIVKGVLTNQQLPLIEIDFGCENVWFLNSDVNKKIDELAFKGFFTTGEQRSLKTAELKIMNVNARPDKGVFKGNFVVRDFTDPQVLMQMNADLELKFIGEFFGIKDLQQIGGRIRLDMNFKELADMEFPEETLYQLKNGLQSELTVYDLAFKIPGFPHQIKNMYLHAAMKDGKLDLDSASLKVGRSDLQLEGAIDNLPALIHKPDEKIALRLAANSKKIVLKELFSFDTTKAKKIQEEVNDFSIDINLETSVGQLRKPQPLPKGKFTLNKLNAAFKNYPHAFHNVKAAILIDDTTLTLNHFKGLIDDSDISLSGLVNNYPLWFSGVKKGRTKIVFDLRSDKLVIKDVLGPLGKEYLPEAYLNEIAHKLSARADLSMRYDSVFRMLKADIANISGNLEKHRFRVREFKGELLYGADRILKIDSLKGKIGRTDFALNLRLFAGKDKRMKKRTNYLDFRSRFIDLDEINNYSFISGSQSISVEDSSVAQTAISVTQTPATSVKADSSIHANTFNIFKIPFSDFKVNVDIGRLKYNKLWVKNIRAGLRMQEDKYIHLDTIAMQIADGTLAMKGYLNGNDPDKIYFNSIIKINNLDLEHTMIKLDHFGQDITINKNIRGKLNGTIKSHLRIHPDFVPVINDSKAELDVEIYNGSLIDFAPMQAMAGYFKDKNLRLVRFDTLKNVLTLKDSELNIPSMNINSSLGFIEVSGKQSLNLNMEYYMRIPMKMVTNVGFRSLFGKKQEEVDIDQIDEIEYRDANKKVWFMNVKVSGTPDNYKVGLGKDKKKD